MGIEASYCLGKFRRLLDVHFCIEAVEEAMGKHGKPDIFNTDLGSQFTSQAFTVISSSRAES